MIKILTTGRLGKEFFSAIKEIGKEFDIKYAEVPAPGDIEWTDCLAAFSLPDEINISGIKWIHSFGAGAEGFLQRKDISNTTILTRTVGNLGFKMGEFCLCHFLNFFQDTFKIYENNKLKRWECTHPQSLRDKTVLILGTGEMAKGISRILYTMRIKVVGVNTEGSSPGGSFSECITFNELNTMANRISCIINTLPLTQKTRGLLDRQFFDHFHDVLFINVGRGKSVVTGDLIAAIDNCSVLYAVLDVFDVEPLPEASPLWDNPKVFISPHQSAVTDIQDVIDSFLTAHRLIKSNKRNNLFVDFAKGY